MADMTTKHHLLIQDCIVEGLKKFLKLADYAVDDQKSRIDALGVARDITSQFADNLRYTHDKFDADRFRSRMRMLLNDVIKVDRENARKKEDL